MPRNGSQIEPLRPNGCHLPAMKRCAGKRRWGETVRRRCDGIAAFATVGFWIPSGFQLVLGGQSEVKVRQYVRDHLEIVGLAVLFLATFFLPGKSVPFGIDALG